MSQILEENFNSFIGATYGCEPIELPGEQLRGLRFAFFGGAMIVHTNVLEKQRESDVELFNLQEELEIEFTEYKKELLVYDDEEIKYSFSQNLSPENIEEILERKFDTLKDARKKLFDLQKILIRKINCQNDVDLHHRARKKESEVLNFIKSQFN